VISQETETLLEHGSDWAEVSVVVPLYNYETYITDTLNSVATQTLEDVSLVVVDDCSKDSSAQVVKRWIEENPQRFSKAKLARNVRNAGLAITRNTGIAIAGSPKLFFLDADNLIYPRCLARHVDALSSSPAARGAYSLLEVFDADRRVIGAEVFDRARLKRGNHIDAMAMIRREYLLEIGGYHDIKHGWEDFDLWLRMCESDDFLIQIPEILGRYRVHHQSMLRTTTNVGNNHLALRENITSRHPWLELD